ncbi:MAG: hypothetical protein KatS3mg029_0105 [Saprospiraceae bacterium]|nr:MAG: hypothetical protein KatS3mg029_0105 [Saprospiraceae bacterium]
MKTHHHTHVSRPIEHFSESHSHIDVCNLSGFQHSYSNTTRGVQSATFPSRWIHWQTLVSILASVFLLFCSVHLQAQKYDKPTRVFKGNQTDLVFSVGLVPTYAADKAAVIVPPLQASINHMFSSKFGLDVQLGYSSTQTPKHEISEGLLGNWLNDHYYLAIRPTFHVTRFDNFDIYGGAAIGMHYTTLTPNADMTNGNRHLWKEYEMHHGMGNQMKATYTGFVGARYAISDRLTAQAEAGFATTLLSVGLGFKL